MRKTLVLIIFLCLVKIAHDQELSYISEIDISYYSEDISSDNQYIAERCKLDIYYPENIKGDPSLIFVSGHSTGG